MNKEILIGAHLSVSGGIENAIDKAVELKCRVLQVFTKNARQWTPPPLKEENIARFIEKQKEAKLIIASHDSYLINLAIVDKEKRRKSIASFTEELKRAKLLDIPFLVFHPGVANEVPDVNEGIKLIVEALNETIEKSENENTKILLETTAGQKHSIGHTFQQLRDIIDKSKYKEKLAVCFDTCHVFAAGYNIKIREGYEKTIEEFDKILGLKLLSFFHFNDSKGDLGLHLDRHEHIGKGKLGLDPFRFILNDKRFEKIGKCLETPKGDDDEMDEVNLEVLRSLVK